jgi:hypothetical protein
MKALINKSNEIVDVQFDELIFDVHPDFIWVDCPDETTVDYFYIDGEFVEKVFEVDVDVERVYAYKTIGEQLDMIWHEIENTGTISDVGEWFTHIKNVKESLPKDI